MSIEINLTPTDEGYVNILRTFIQSILSDVKVARRHDATILMSSVVDIANYLDRTRGLALADEVRARA